MKPTKKIFLYLVFGLTALVLFLYFRFPSEMVQTAIEERVRQADPNAHLETDLVSPTIPPGLKLEPLSVRYAGLPVLRILAGNPGARISEFGFRELIERSRADEQLQDVVSLRDDFPGHLIESLAQFACERVRDRLRSVNGESLDAPLVGSEARIEAVCRPVEPGDPAFEEKRQYLLNVYAQNLLRDTCLFPGMSEILSFLEDRGTPWGIVTNKPAWLTDPLIEAMQLQHRAGAVVSGRLLRADGLTPVEGLVVNVFFDSQSGLLGVKSDVTGPDGSFTM